MSIILDQTTKIQTGLLEVFFVLGLKYSVLTGWLWRSAGVWSVRPDVSVRGGELGWALRPKEQTGGLHEGHELQQMDWRKNKSVLVHKGIDVSLKMKLRPKVTRQAFWWKQFCGICSCKFLVSLLQLLKLKVYFISYWIFVLCKIFKWLFISIILRIFILSLLFM